MVYQSNLNKTEISDLIKNPESLPDTPCAPFNQRKATDAAHSPAQRKYRGKN
jgi:hypothetical protein